MMIFPRRFRLLTVSQRGRQNQLWQCSLFGFYFDDYSLYPLNDRITFSIGGNVICVDQKFYVYIKQKYFVEEMKNGNCWEKSLNSHTFISCLKSFSMAKVSRISIIIGKWSLSYSIEDLFENDAFNSKYFQMVNCHSKLEEPFSWSLGYKHLKNFVIVFDKEKEELSLLPHK